MQPVVRFYRLTNGERRLSFAQSSIRPLNAFSRPRLVLLSNRRCFEARDGFVALRFLRGTATL